MAGAIRSRTLSQELNISISILFEKKMKIYENEAYI